MFLFYEATDLFKELDDEMNKLYDPRQTHNGCFTY